MTCKCIKEVNKLLEPKGEELVLAFSTQGSFTHYVVGTRKKFGRGKATLLIANFCPFCGVRCTK